MLDFRVDMVCSFLEQGRAPLTLADSPAYTTNMSSRTKQAANPCLCDALRQASRAVTRVYDQEMRSVRLRTTQYALLAWLGHAGEVRQRDLVALTHLDETTLTRNL